MKHLSFARAERGVDITGIRIRVACTARIRALMEAEAPRGGVVDLDRSGKKPVAVAMLLPDRGTALKHLLKRLHPTYIGRGSHYPWLQLKGHCHGIGSSKAGADLQERAQLRAPQKLGAPAQRRLVPQVWRGHRV